MNGVDVDCRNHRYTGRWQQSSDDGLVSFASRAIVHSDSLWPTAPFHNLFHAADHPIGRQRKINLNHQSFTIEVIQDVQEPKSRFIHQTVRHEIHGPGPVWNIWDRRLLFRLFANKAPTQFNPQVEFQIPINPINPLMVPEMSLHIVQIQETQTKSPSPMSLCQSRQQIGNPVILLCQSWTIAKAGLGYLKNPTGQCNAAP
ncbi:hypothetical protein CBI36_10915 [Acetobacter oryzifermentans]|uniref:Uncharacterized protein n=1 Tax=Acetobacter oryzifermentans TaxID=1633874 RepID=A0ABC8CFI7_9PROT|nr:hypothetical protein CBI36_10915 [Acetobacter oryzifermentans]